MAQDKATRRTDGKPETAADKRFFDLRESGYKGPINQDGYADCTPREAELLEALGRAGRR